MKKSTAKILWNVFKAAYFGFFLCVCFSVHAYAYIDPAATAMITQVVAGIFISIGVMFGVFRRKIVVFFRNLSVKRMKRSIEKQNMKESGRK